MTTKKKPAKKRAKKTRVPEETVYGADLKPRTLGQCEMKGCRKKAADVLLFGVDPLPFCRDHFDGMKPWIARAYQTVPPDLLAKNEKDLGALRREVEALRRDAKPVFDLATALRDFLRPELREETEVDDGYDYGRRR